MNRADVLDRAAAVYADALADMAAQPAAETATAAYVPGGPSLAELTDRIKERRQRDERFT